MAEVEKEMVEESGRTGCSSTDVITSAATVSETVQPAEAIDGTGNVSKPSSSDVDVKGVKLETMNAPNFAMPDAPIKKLASKSKEPMSESTSDKQVDEKPKKVDGAPSVESNKSNKLMQIPLSYTEPPWGGICSADYSFEVLKNGKIIESMLLKGKSKFVIGRLQNCDAVMEHPSLSRYHAVIQYCSNSVDNMEKGWYVYDMGSTHGTRVNKNQLIPERFQRIHVGYMLKFGGSSRHFILQGPADDEEAESELSITELKQMKLQQELAEKTEEVKAETQADGCSWGMDMSEPEQTSAEAEENAFSFEGTETKEEYFTDDPKKSLRGYFEREGYDMPEYQFEETGFGKHTCRVELPVDTATGQPLVAEVTVSGKKKEAVVQCALQACRMLDRLGVLRASKHESRKRREKDWAEADFYDSDDDTFTDRTGHVERKRKRRMEQHGHKQNDDQPQTYESLKEKLTQIEKDIAEREEKLEKSKKSQQLAAVSTDSLDALDAYMSTLRAGALDTSARIRVKAELLELRKDQARLQRLVGLAAPASLPVAPKTASSSGKLMIGKMKRSSSSLTKRPLVAPTVQKPKTDEVEAEEEEDETVDGDVRVPPEPAAHTNTDILDPTDSVPNSMSTSQQQSNEQKKSMSSEQKGSDESRVDDSHVDDSRIDDSRIDAETREKSSESTADRLVQDADGLLLPRRDIREVTPANYDVVQAIEEEPTLETRQDVTRTDAAKKKSEAKRSRQRKAKLHSSLAELKSQLAGEEKVESFSSDDPDFSAWLPPSNQTGDGKTHLNEKYGY